MLTRIFCCLNKKPNTLKNEPVLSVKTYNLIEEKCIRVIDNDSQVKQLGLLDTKSLYDSTEWLNTLKNPIDWNDCQPFVPPIEKGLVIKVYDGDTITIASKLPYLGSPVYRFSVRLNGIDCPEIKGKDENERNCAQIAKQEVSQLLMHKVIELKNVKTEKFGRILADVYVDNLYLNEHMIKKRLAISYDGGTKITPKNWMDYYFKGEL